MRCLSSVVVVCLFLGLAACSSEDAAPAVSPIGTPPASTTTSTVASQSAPTTSPVRSPVASLCSGALPPGLAAGESRLQQLSLGVDIRTYHVYVPSSFDNTRLVPLVLNFHGLGGFAEDQEELSGLVPVAEREEFILVSPQGMGAPASWNFGSGVGIFPGGPDDVGFVGDLLDALASGLCVDQSRVYAAGFSNGAFFASTLACRLPGRIAAVAPVAGVDYPADGCPGVVPILAFHGTTDAVVPFLPGAIFGLLRYDGARAYVASWADLGGCKPAAGPEPIVAGAAIERYDCDNDVEVALVVTEGLGHAWPDIAADRIWAFFERYSLPR